MTDIKKYMDVVKDMRFREAVNARLKQYSDSNTYSIFSPIPCLYRYRSFNKYSVEDIVNKDIVLTSIGEFNDAMEGNIALYKSEKEIENKVENTWRDHQKFVAGGCPICDTRETIEKRTKDLMARDLYNTATLMKNIGTYIGCFSEKPDIALMWAHYADSHRGICIGYTDALFDNRSFLRDITFPICYSSRPVYVGDFMEDKESRKLCEYPIDVATLCSVINKHNVWGYEREWRVVWIMDVLGMAEQVRRTPIKKAVRHDLLPYSISFGYHFFQNFFYYRDEKDSYNDAKERLTICLRLLDFIASNSIKCYYLRPKFCSFEFDRIEVSINELQKFIIQEFIKLEPRDIKFYNSCLFDWLKKISDV